MFQALRWLARQSRRGEIWFHFSGHGGWTYDASSDERDRRDETIVCLDGVITDDQIHEVLVKHVPRTSNAICTMDCCHSGTALDLKYLYVSGNRNVQENRNAKGTQNIVCLSGCRDVGTSADAYFDGKWAGAMPKHLLDVLREANYQITIYSLLRKLRLKLRRGRFRQIPQITTNKRLNGLSPFIG